VVGAAGSSDCCGGSGELHDWAVDQHSYLSFCTVLLNSFLGIHQYYPSEILSYGLHQQVLSGAPHDDGQIPQTSSSVSVIREGVKAEIQL
jgi:hypothetical protein